MKMKKKRKVIISKKDIVIPKGTVFYDCSNWTSVFGDDNYECHFGLDDDTTDPWYKRLYRHQEARIWRMIQKEFPDLVILDEETIRWGDDNEKCKM